MKPLCICSNFREQTNPPQKKQPELQPKTDIVREKNPGKKIDLPSDRGMGRVEHLRTFSSDLESWDSREREKISDVLGVGLGFLVEMMAKVWGEKTMKKIPSLKRT